jgi:hypothetical protein
VAINSTFAQLTTPPQATACDQFEKIIQDFVFAL